MSDDCEVCRTEGPMLPGIVADATHLHRTWHSAWLAVAFKMGEALRRATTT